MAEIIQLTIKVPCLECGNTHIIMAKDRAVEWARVCKKCRQMTGSTFERISAGQKRSIELIIDKHNITFRELYEITFPHKDTRPTIDYTSFLEAQRLLNCGNKLAFL